MGIFDLFAKELTVNEGINRARADKSAFLIDCRRKDDFKKGYVAGAVNLPMDKLEQLAKNRIHDLNAPIYVIGSYADPAKKAVKALKKLGYTNVTPCGNMEEHYGLLKK